MVCDLVSVVLAMVYRNRPSVIALRDLDEQQQRQKLAFLSADARRSLGRKDGEERGQIRASMLVGRCSVPKSHPLLLLPLRRPPCGGASNDGIATPPDGIRTGQRNL
jgi:hypothetical protein